VAALYTTVTIPPAVRNEITRQGAGAEELATADWLIIQAPRNRLRVSQLAAELDRGEAEAISLALELGAVLLIDEYKGRQRALALGLECVRSGAILIAAKTVGLIDAVRPLVMAMDQADVHLGQDAIRAILRAAGED
jgi:hypothetical protein